MNSGEDAVNIEVKAGQTKRFAALLFSSLVSAGLVGCADDSNNLLLIGGTTGGSTGGSTGGATGGSTTGTDNCTTCTTTPVNPTGGLADCDPANPAAPFKPLGAATVKTTTNGLCLSITPCKSDSPTSAFDGNLKTYAVDTAQLGLPTTAVTVDGYGPTTYTVPAGKFRTAGFFVAYPTNSVADANLLSNTQTNMLNATGGVIPTVSPSSNTPATNIGLTLLGTGVTIPGLTNTISIAFVPVYSNGQNFNGLEQVYAPTIAALGELDVIEACVQK
jgi:hypothetical protein